MNDFGVRKRLLSIIMSLRNIDSNKGRGTALSRKVVLLLLLTEAAGKNHVCS
jgi:hypothetical protein